MTLENTLVNEEMKSIIDGFPRTAQMGVLAALTSALTAFINQ
jgi:citrate synthase